MKKIKLLLILFSFTSFGQTITLKGKLIDIKSEPIAFANIVLVNIENTFNKGITSDIDGNFTFNNLNIGDYTLKISFLGYKDYSTEIKLTKTQTLNPITLEDNATSLNEVEVNYKKPTIVQKANKLIFNIENTILSNHDSWNILNNTPNVFINQDKLTVKSNLATIYIDDKKVELPTDGLKSFLENLDGNSIKSIEVIANPSAKYEASSSSIINIVLKKKFKNHYKGNINTNYSIGKYDKYSIGTTHFYKKNKLGITASFTISKKKHIIEETEEINFFDTQNILTSNWFSTTDNFTNNLKHNLLIDMNYAISKNSLLGFSVLNNELNNEKNTIVTDGLIFSNTNVLETIYKAKNIADRSNKLRSYVLDFDQNLNNKGEKIITTISYSLYNNDRKQKLNTDYFLADNSFLKNKKFNISSNQDIKILTSKIDYVLPLKAGEKFESGIKFSSIDTENDFKQFDFINNDLVLDVNKSNIFSYKETNFALYSTYQKENETFYYQFGLRGEFTDLKGNSKTVNGNEINTKDYFKLFPNILLNYYPNKNNDFSLTYKKSINRPKYNELNPFMFFFSDYSANVGNPDLKPEIIHMVDFNYILKSKYVFNLYYGIRKDKTSEIAFQDNETNIVRYINVNLDNYESIGLIMSGTNEITKRWSIFTQLFFANRTYDFIALESNNELIRKSKASYFINLVNNFTFLKDKSLKASLTYKYISPDNHNGSSEVSRYLQTNFSIQKTLFKNKAVLTFGIDDVFNTTNYLLTTKYKNQDIRYFSNPDTHFYKIGFRYSFGNNKLTENSKTKSIKEEQRLKK